MLHTRNVILGLIPAFALGFLSCTTDITTEKEENIAEDEAMFVAADRESDLYGTYRAFVISPGTLSLLVLKTDGTYHRAIPMPCPTWEPCDVAEDDGQFSIRHGAVASYLVLYSDTGGVGKYEFVLQGDTMRIRPFGQKSFVLMEKTAEESWCGERRDCFLQNLSVPSCPGVWHCGANLCDYACMNGPVEDPRPVEDPDPN